MSRSMEAKRHCDAGNMDRVSNLPMIVIELILELLPLQDAIRTSILSRNWRFNWVTRSELLLNNEFFDSFPSLKENFVSFVHKILSVHSGPIQKFALSIPADSVPRNKWSVSKDVEQWLLVLLKNGIKELTLNNLGSPLKVPPSLFSCTKLTHLRLALFTINKLPPEFPGFPNLILLDLCQALLDKRTFEKLISSCPVLEILSLTFCKKLNEYSFNAPNLKYLNVFDIKKNLWFINTPNLTTASLSVDCVPKYSEQGNTSNLVKALGSLPRIESFSLSLNILKFLAAGGVPKRLPTSFVHLKKLALFNIRIDALDQFACFTCLIQSSPNLQELQIDKVEYCKKVAEPALKYLEEQDSADITLSQLRIVKIQRIMCLGVELSFIKILFACSPSLETIVITFAAAVDDTVARRISAEWLQCPPNPPLARNIELIIGKEVISELD